MRMKEWLNCQMMTLKLILQLEVGLHFGIIAGLELLVIIRHPFISFYNYAAISNKRYLYLYILALNWFTRQFTGHPSIRIDSAGKPMVSPRTKPTDIGAAEVISPPARSCWGLAIPKYPQMAHKWWFNVVCIGLYYRCENQLLELLRWLFSPLFVGT